MRAAAAALLGFLAASLTSSPASAESQSLKIGARGTMDATLFRPDGPGPYPAVLVLHTSGGLEHSDVDFARTLSAQGYVTLVPAFLAAYGITPAQRAASFTTQAEAIYADFVDAIARLKRDDKVKGGKVGALGFSNGGYFAVWLAATGKADAGVSYYGALSGAGTDRELNRFKMTLAAGSAPILLLHGTNDETVPIAAAQRLNALMDSARARHQTQFYDGATHRFERDTRSSSNAPAAKDAWSRTLAFLAETLKP